MNDLVSLFYRSCMQQCLGHKTLESSKGGHSIVDRTKACTCNYCNQTCHKENSSMNSKDCNKDYKKDHTKSSCNKACKN